MKKILTVLLFVMFLSVPVSYAGGPYDKFLDWAYEKLKAGDVKNARAKYDLYKKSTGKRDYRFEDLLEKKDIRQNKLAKLRGRVMRGDVDAMLELGKCYEKLEEYSNAASSYRKAAAKGNAEAMHKLGDLYAKGKGVPKSSSKSRKWYKLSEENGYEEECPAKLTIEEVRAEETCREEVFRAVDEMPRFPGGDGAMSQWLAENIKYPEKAQENNIQGRVIVQFVVTKTGKIGQVKVVKSVDRDLDREAIRLVKSLPEFIPGKMNGQPVNVWFTLPINFRLE